MSERIDLSAARTVSRWGPPDTIMLILITIGAAIVRFIRLGDPDDIMFDETYYAKDACWFVKVNPEVCEVDSEQTMVHPPLGKWFLAIGIRLFGYDAFGWRVGAAVAGVITVALLYLLGRRLLSSTVGASLASGLLAIDFLHVVQSRIAMLDIFPPLFGIAATLFVVYDRDRIIARFVSHREPASAGDPPEGGESEGVMKREGSESVEPAHEPEPQDPVPPERGNGLLDRPWRLAAGAAAGAATASKWAGVFFLVLVVVLTITWEISGRRRDGRAHVLKRFFSEEALSIALWLLLVPALVYVATYSGRVRGDLMALPWAEGSWLRAVWEQQFSMLDFHSDLSASHIYQSPAWSWLLIKRPVSYFFEGSNGMNMEIFALGSPLVWWTALLAMLFVAYRWVRRHDMLVAEGTILAGFFFTYVPWLVQTTDREATFIFYVLPVVPFLCLALAYVASQIGSSWEARTAVGLFGTAAVALFIYFWPLLTKVEIPENEWKARIWFEDCARDPAEVTTATVTDTVDGNEIIRTDITTESEAPPPEGWCWI